MKRKNTILKSILIALLAVSCIFSLAAVVSSASDTDASWTFTTEAVKDPLYIKEYFDTLPRAYEAVVEFPSGSLASASPVISNYPSNTSRDTFGFEITKNGNPAIYYYTVAYDAANYKLNVNKIHVPFNYDVRGKGEIRLTVVNEIESGSSVYKLYVDGALSDTVTSKPQIQVIDPIYSQSTTREMSIGSDGSNYFKGELKSVAVYAKALTADEAASPAKTHLANKSENLLAYYDASMSGNSEDTIKDQTGKGHDATKAFYARKTAVADYAYSFAFVGDTQFLVGQDVKNNTTKYSSPIYDWIVANKVSKNIQRVFGLGDVTDADGFAEWELAVKLHEKLSLAGIPYSIVPGNHDDMHNYVKYNGYFGEVAAFTDEIDGYYLEGRVENYYRKFDVGEHKYMVIALQYGAPDEVLTWANKIVGENSDRRVIVITHNLFGYDGTWNEAGKREQSTSSEKNAYFNNGIDIWNDFISLHENIIIAAAGHVDPEHIKHHTYVGVHGNTVNTFLIDPQGLDKATAYDTGMVAMFYFSEDGTDVQVEYISTTKTVAAKASDPAAEDILFHERNQFTFKTDVTASSSTYTEYGLLPDSCKADGNIFAIFSGGEFVSGYPTWNAATGKVAEMLAADSSLDVQMLLLSDHVNTGDGTVNNAFNYANGSVTVDLGGHTFTRVGTFLNLNNYSDIKNVAASNVTVKNGTVLSGGKPIVNNQITNQAYTAEKVWNVTFDGVTFGLTADHTESTGVFYQAWTNSATSDSSQLGAITNITLNNCVIDLKTNAPTSGVTLFGLQDNRGLDKVDVNLKILGGKLLADIDALEGVEFYTKNAGDSILFGAYDSEYTKLITHTTEFDYSHYAGAFPSADGERYFVEISDNGEESVYELRSLKIAGDDVTGVISLGADNVDVKYLSAVDYPFAIFDQTGKFYGASDYLMGKQSGTSAIGRAIYDILEDYNTYDSEKGKYNDGAYTAYILMRADYTMRTYTDGTSEKQESFNNISHAKGSVVIDMRGYSIIADSSRTNHIFDATVKLWPDSAAGLSFPSYYTVKNGAFKIHSAAVLRLYASNNGKNISAKLMSWTFDNVNFGLLEGSTQQRFFHVSAAAGTTSVAPVELILNDCVYDLESVAPTKTFTVFCSNFINTTYIKANVRINGGRILAKNLDMLEFTNFSDYCGSTMYFGAGSDGNYLELIMPRTASTSKFSSVKMKREKASDLVFGLETEAAKSIYSSCITTDYGTVPVKYEDTELYPFYVFVGGVFKGAYLEWGLDSGLSALSASKAEGSTVLMRRHYEYTASGQYNNLSQTKGLTVDFGGFTFTSSKRSLVMAQKKLTNGVAHDTNITFKNGTVILGPNALIRMDTAESYTGGTEFGFNFVFEGITFELASGAATDTVICYNTFNTSDPSQYCNFTFNKCVFDLSKVSKPLTMFDMSDSRCIVTAVINGGKIMTSGASLSPVSSTVGNAESSLTFGNESGAYTELYIPTGSSLPINAVNGGALEFVYYTSKEGYDVYTLATPTESEPISTKYGNIPGSDHSRIALFIKDADSETGYTFNAGFATFAEAASAAGLIGTGVKGKDAVILLRDDYYHTTATGSIRDFYNDVLIDLDEHTVYIETKTLSFLQLAGATKSDNFGKITVIDGKFYLNVSDTGTSVVRLDGTQGVYSIDFDNVTIASKLTRYAAVSTKGTSANTVKVVFNNCKFDYTEAPNPCYMIASGNKGAIEAKVNGGEIIAGSKDIFAIDYAGTSANKFALTYYVSPFDDTVSYGKSTSGKYMSITLKQGVTLPDYTVNGGELTFIKSAVGEGTVTYTLVPTSATQNFTPKANITLDSNLIFNIYLPTTKNVVALALNGENREIKEEDGYYVISEPLNSFEAAKTLTLEVTIDVDGTKLKGTFTFSTLAYAESVYASTTNENEITLVSDVLAYIKSAYTYFEKTDEAAMAKIDELLLAHPASAFPETVNPVNTISGKFADVASITFILSDTPALVLYLENGVEADSLTYSIGGRELAYTKGKDATGDYVIVTGYAHLMTDTITVSRKTPVEGEVNSGEINLEAYYDLQKNNNAKATLIDIVEKFYNYCASAKAYRNSVMNPDANA